MVHKSSHGQVREILKMIKFSERVKHSATIERKIVEYILLFSDSQDGISSSVNKYIGLGWQPYFGTKINIDQNYNNDYFQAMVKYG